MRLAPSRQITPTGPRCDPTPWYSGLTPGHARLSHSRRLSERTGSHVLHLLWPYWGIQYGLPQRAPLVTSKPLASTIQGWARLVTDRVAPVFDGNVWFACSRRVAVLPDVLGAAPAPTAPRRPPFRVAGRGGWSGGAGRAHSDWASTAGGQAREHLLHGQPAQHLGAAEQVVAGQVQLPGPVGGPHPWPGHRDAAPAQGDRPCLTAMPAARPASVVLALRAVQGGH